MLNYKNMKKLLIFVGLSVTLFGALPPLVQSSQEIQNLLADSELYTLLGNGQPVQAIFRTEEGYVVMTKKTLLRVGIEYLSQGRPGPRVFRFHFYPPVSLSGGAEKAGEESNGSRCEILNCN